MVNGLVRALNSTDLVFGTPSERQFGQSMNMLGYESSDISISRQCSDLTLDRERIHANSTLRTFEYATDSHLSTVLIDFAADDNDSHSKLSSTLRKFGNRFSQDGTSSI
jgi:hypothetical protein